MAQIIIDIPTEKVPIVRDAVLYRTNEVMTDQEVLDYVTSYLKSHLINIVQVQQRAMYMESYVFDDPTV